MCFEAEKIWNFSLDFFTVFNSKFGDSGKKIEAPQTTSLAPGASIGENTVFIGVRPNPRRTMMTGHW